MKYFTLLFSLCVFSLCSEAQNNSSIHNLNVSEVIDKGMIQVAQINGPVFLNQEKRERALKLGETFFETSYLETGKKSLVKLILPNNSLMYIGPDSTIKLHEIKGKGSESSLTFEIIRGRMRMVGYKGHHYVKSPKGAIYFKDADIQWDVYRVEKAIVSEVKQFSGEIVSKGELVKKLEAKDRPEVNISGIDSMNQPWERWLGKAGVSHDYALSYIPNFSNSKKKERGRAIASLESPETQELELDSEFILMSDESGEEEQYSYPVTSKEIYVHENLFDHVLIHVQRAAQDKAKEIVASSYELAAKEIVWEVASRSLIRWGTQYAQRAALDEIPENLRSMFQEIEKRDINFRKSKIYVDSVERISQLKSYTAAKKSIENEASSKAITESQAYILALTKKIITEPIRYKVYKHAKEIAQITTKEFMNKSELLHTEDVANLVEYLSQVAAKRYTENEINRIEEKMSYKVAKSAVLEANNRGADKIASFISEKVSKRTAQLFNKMLDQEVGERAARGLASENQVQLGHKYKSSKQMENLR